MFLRLVAFFLAGMRAQWN